MKQQIETGELRNPLVAAGLRQCAIEVDAKIRDSLPHEVADVANQFKTLVAKALSDADISVTQEQSPVLRVSFLAKTFNPPSESGTMPAITGIRIGIRLDETVAIVRDTEKDQVIATTWNSGATTALFAGTPSLLQIANLGREVLEEQIQIFLLDRKNGILDRQNLFENDPLKKENITNLASILISEASVGNASERQAVGSTVINRMSRNGTQKVSDVWSAYAHAQIPTAEFITLSTRLLHGPLQDNTNGATHFYSPRSMPMDGDDTTGFDVGGGLEQTEGLSKKNYRPGWTTTYIAQSVRDARPAYFKFFMQPGTGPVT